MIHGPDRPRGWTLFRIEAESFAWELKSTRVAIENDGEWKELGLKRLGLAPKSTAPMHESE